MSLEQRLAILKQGLTDINWEMMDYTFVYPLISKEEYDKLADKRDKLESEIVWRIIRTNKLATPIYTNCLTMC